MEKPRTALLLGATGLVGGHCLDLLLADDSYAPVTTLGRRLLTKTHAKLTHHVIDFDAFSEHADVLAADDVFCCLGTTIKQAGSQEAFRTVDFTYPFEAARIALAKGAQQYLLVSSLGANRASRIFYNRVKGETEDAIRALDYAGMYIFRPSLLTGDRDEKRRGEQIAEAVLKTFSFTLRGPLRTFRPTAARDVATAMIHVAKQQPGDVKVYEPEAIKQEASGS
ncbi:MAG TPA: hypothetical protein VKP65_18415 [Rhodothermales bacterium]|nr:hypothetical protein [Rhodothermales bacterium]